MTTETSPLRTENDSPETFGVRMALPDDEGEILHLLVLMHEENGVYDMDRDLVREGIRRGTRRRGGMIGVVEGPKEIEATIGLMIHPAAWYTQQMALHDMWTFVRPEYRRSEHLKRLVRFGQWASDYFTQAGTPMPYLSAVFSNDRTAAKCRLYRRFGKPMGEFFAYNLQQPHIVTGSPAGAT